MSGSGNRAMFTVRKDSYGVGVERIFRFTRRVSTKSKSYHAAVYGAPNSIIFVKDRGKAARLQGEE